LRTLNYDFSYVLGEQISNGIYKLVMLFNENSIEAIKCETGHLSAGGGVLIGSGASLGPENFGQSKATQKSGGNCILRRDRNFETESGLVLVTALFLLLGFRFSSASRKPKPKF